MNPKCLKCGGELLLLKENVPTYSWQCANKCMPLVDTGVALSEDINPFELVGIKDGKVFEPFFTRPLHSSHIPGAKVYMPFVLYHFIECTWGACYNSIYLNLLVPHLNSVSVLDYVLRSPVVQSDSQFAEDSSQPKMYGNLYSRLLGVESTDIKKYLAETFRTRS
jgi:hypothetical protein